MRAEYELNPDGSVQPAGGQKSADSAFPGKGGSRAGAGRKAADYVKPQVAQEFDEAKMRKERALADQHELAYKIKSGQYVSRAAVREATATVLSQLAQALRSIPDNLERKFDLDPAIAVQIEAAIDASLAELAGDLEMFTN